MTKQRSDLTIDQWREEIKKSSCIRVGEQIQFIPQAQMGMEMCHIVTQSGPILLGGYWLSNDFGAKAGDCWYYE